MNEQERVAMLEEIAKVEPPNDKCDKLNMRLGIHVGRVVAGAGVGRVTGNVLLHVAEQVHLVEVSERLLTQAQEKVWI